MLCASNFRIKLGEYSNGRILDLLVEARKLGLPFLPLLLLLEEGFVSFLALDSVVVVGWTWPLLGIPALRGRVNGHRCLLQSVEDTDGLIVLLGSRIRRGCNTSISHVRIDIL